MKRLQLFPDSARLADGTLTIAGCDLNALAAQHGTPLYVYDRLTLDTAVQTYQGLLAAHYPGRADITYAGKAYLSLGLAQWTQSHGLWIDCTGLGEIGIAVAAGVPAGRILVHGVNKTHADLIAGIKSARTLVVDNLSELEHLVVLARAGSLPDLWLRVQPGMAVETHIHTQTGQAGSKFGMSAEQVREAARISRAAGLPLRGLHFHQGSQFRDPEPLAQGIDIALDLAQEIGFGDDWALSPGGGWGVAYHDDELPHPPLEAYVGFVSQYITAGCAARHLALPHLHLEPGRTIVARAGVALYRVEAVKRIEDRTWLLIDGGMADNIRHALYGARYSALPVSQPERAQDTRVWIAGPYCESGDVMIEDLPFPPVEEGELIAVPMSGAYHLAMASNYNGARRPAVLMLQAGQARLMQTRETAADLLRRDQSIL